ncbi:MAG: hypothetical protein NTU44_03225 [Bacteroidetes bacterium]|nr:hypothetical protein [Bacteroidota bacterium]
MWYLDFYSLWDILLVPLYAFAIIIVAYWWARKKQDEDPVYRFFVPGLFVKIIGGFLFTMVYTFYYTGGDCHAYFWSAKTLVNLFFKDPQPFFSIMVGNTTSENWSYFDYATGWPVESMYVRGGESFSVPRLMVPFSFLAFNHMLVANILLDTFAFIGIWKFFTIIAALYPSMQKKLAVAVFYVPSMVFWGSGIMKDTFALTATLWAVKNVFSIVEKKEKIFGNMVTLLINIFLLISIKPYIAVALVPCLGLAVSHQWIVKIKNQVLGLFLAPSLIGLGLLIGILSLSLISSRMGSYSSMEGIISKAQINQADLSRSEQYGTHKFDIGGFDASVSGMLIKAPRAIIAGIYRPFLWEAGSVVMLLSALENTVFLLLTIYILMYSGIKTIFRSILQEPYLVFALTFSLIFAFSVGLSTANFGALVRYKIPGIPFFVSTLVILYEKYKETKVLNESTLRPF